MAKSSSSSTNKAAKLAQTGSSRAVRFQGGTVFPLAIAITLVLGLALIAYARQSRPAADASPPTIDDHWHATYGFYLCDTWYELTGALEETNSQGNLVNTRFLASGVHSHDDGLMHWHPFSSVSVGQRAKLGVFFRSYGVELSDDELKFPDNNVPPAGQEFIEGETKCGTEDAELSVKTWNVFTSTESDATYITNFNEIQLKQDGMVFGIYFTPKDADRPKPPKADQQQELGAIDAGPGANIPISATTVPAGPVVSLPGSDSTTPENATETSEPTETTSPDAETTATTITTGSTVTTATTGG